MSAFDLTQYVAAGTAVLAFAFAVGYHVTFERIHAPGDDEDPRIAATLRYGGTAGMALLGVGAIGIAVDAARTRSELLSSAGAGDPAGGGPFGALVGVVPPETTALVAIGPATIALIGSGYLVYALRRR